MDDILKKREDVFVPPSEISKEREYCELLKDLLSARFGERPKACVRTYGCQGNVSDGERIKGMLRDMGFSFVNSPEEADFVLFNTCAVREHAEDRVLGNVGALKPVKEKKRGMIIALSGCMTQQKHISELIKNSYPYVNIVFGTFSLYKLPEALYKVLTTGGRVFYAENENGRIAEGVAPVREYSYKAFLPVMYGCDNFCSYCVVPLVRGRERSRRPEDILKEAKELVDSGVKEITLLGQNVNSYGKNPDYGVNFSDLLKQINSLDGDFIIRFMTSHPKDCTKELIDALRDCEKCAPHLHLPVQCGSDRILRLMNRKYTRKEYLSLIDYAKKTIPDISITSDIMVGFPGETYEDFKETLSLIKEVRYASLFTFIYSKREGTRAALMEDPAPYSEKSKWFKELLSEQEKIASQRSRNMIGNTYRCLIEDNEKDGRLTGRTGGNVSIKFDGNKELVGNFARIKVTKAGNWVLEGEPVQ